MWGILRRILSIPHNIVMNLSNVIWGFYSRQKINYNPKRKAQGYIHPCIVNTRVDYYSFCNGSPTYMGIHANKIHGTRGATINTIVLSNVMKRHKLYALKR